MFDRKIIAQNITNLTDARYFAAWGVEYISFNLEMDSPYYIPWEKAKEIIDWVEGPKALVDAAALEFLEGADGHILSSIYSSLPLNKMAFFRTPIIEFTKGLPSGHYIIKPLSSELDTLKNIAEEKLLGCDIYIDITDLSLDEIKDLPPFGLVVQGGEEEKVGVKSYDDLDLIYDWLLDS